MGTIHKQARRTLLTMRFSTLVEVALVGVFVFIAAAAVAESDQAEGNSIECNACIEAWSELRKFGGCDDPSTVGEFCKYFCPSWLCGNATTCQHEVNEVSSYGCDTDPSECSYIACSELLDVCPKNDSRAIALGIRSIKKAN